MELEIFFSQHKKAALAFSGGTDSAYLLYAAKQSGLDIQPYFVKTEFQPDFELDDAKRLAKELGIELKIIRLCALSDHNIRQNAAGRCYYCKRHIMQAIQTHGQRDGYVVLFDGTNASDEEDERPGMAALKELGVLSPLKLCAVTKDEVRKRSKAAGLFTWNKPSYACLATRIPTGYAIEKPLLEAVHAAETFLSGLGFADFRVRILPQSGMQKPAAKLQVPLTQLHMALNKRRQIAAEFIKYFDGVLLDLEPR